MVTKVCLEEMGGDNRDRFVASKACCKAQEQSALCQDSVVIKWAPLVLKPRHSLVCSPQKYPVTGVCKLVLLPRLKGELRD